MFANHTILIGSEYRCRVIQTPQMDSPLSVISYILWFVEVRGAAWPPPLPFLLLFFVLLNRARRVLGIEERHFAHGASPFAKSLSSEVKACAVVRSAVVPQSQIVLLPAHAHLQIVVVDQRLEQELEQVLRLEWLEEVPPRCEAISDPVQDDGVSKQTTYGEPHNLFGEGLVDKDAFATRHRIGADDGVNGLQILVLVEGGLFTGGAVL